MKVLVTRDLKEEYLEAIRSTVPEYNVVKVINSKKQEEEIVDADILITFPAMLGVEKIFAARNLKWIQSWSAGVDTLTEPDILKFLLENEIRVTSMSGIHCNIIAEHVMGMVISFSRKLYKCYSQQKNQVWQRPRLGQLEGRTMAVVGLGNIGREIATRAKAFKMRVIGSKRDVNTPVENVDSLYSPDELLLMLKKADYVVVAVPLTDETSGMFGRDEFKAMKESAFFINIARGKVVVEAELIRALEEGMIRGAGLDVFKEEPLPSDSPLYRLDNVLITPHVAGIFPDYNKKAMKILLENLKRYREGEELINLVDYNKGY